MAPTSSTTLAGLQLEAIYLPLCWASVATDELQQIVDYGSDDHFRDMIKELDIFVVYVMYYDAKTDRLNRAERSIDDYLIRTGANVPAAHLSGLVLKYYLQAIRDSSYTTFDHLVRRISTATGGGARVTDRDVEDMYAAYFRAGTEDVFNCDDGPQDIMKVLKIFVGDINVCNRCSCIADNLRLAVADLVIPAHACFGNYLPEIKDNLLGMIGLILEEVTDAFEDSDDCRGEDVAELRRQVVMLKNIDTLQKC